MRSLTDTAPVLMSRYAAYHRDRRNIVTHFIGVPMIFLAMAMWLAFPLGRQWGDYGITGAWLMWALTSFWYLTRGDMLLGLATAVVNGVLAAPLMAVMMLIARNRKAMRSLTLSTRATITGWAATAVMAVGTIVFFATL